MQAPEPTAIRYASGTLCTSSASLLPLPPPASERFAGWRQELNSAAAQLQSPRQQPAPTATPVPQLRTPPHCAQTQAMAACLQRLSAAACSGLGFSGARITAAAAASSASSSALWLRAYSDAAAGAGDKPAEAAAAEAAPAEEAAAAAADGEGGSGGEVVAAAEAAEVEAPAPQPIHPALIDPVDGSAVPPELFTKRQLARMGVEEPEKYKHFLPRLSRKELGSFADEYVDEEFDVEVGGLGGWVGEGAWSAGS